MTQAKLSRAFDLIHYQLASFPKNDCLNTKVKGKWISHSTQEVVDIANRVSLGLLAFGLKPGDKVALVSPNRPEWNFIDLGCQQVGITLVPMYPNITTEDYHYIFTHAGVKMAFVANQEIYDRVLPATKGMDLVGLFTFDDIDGAKSWQEVPSKGEDGDVNSLQEYRDAVDQDDLLTIIYTSGTTGKPKGVMLTHANVMSNVLALDDIADMERGKCRALSFLPMCHIYERTGVYYYFFMGVSIYYAESMDTIADNLKEVSPHTFNTVPRLLEKVYEKIISKGYELSTAKRKIFFWAINLGLKFDPAKKTGTLYRKQLGLANKLIFSKWREALGGEITHISSGAAALQPRLARVFWAAGIKVLEGYGLTETSPVVAASTTKEDGYRLGCVGRVIDGVEVKIADDGEILVKGPNVMQGYYSMPELTSEVLQDGWFHTGDIGELQDGFLKITDRKKELFKTSGGLYIAPQAMESKFKESRYIEHIIVIGEGRKFPSALIVPNFEVLKEWAEKKMVIYANDEGLVNHPKVTAMYSQEIEVYNKEFGKWAKVKKFKVLAEDWGIDSGELTPTLKMKRKAIHRKYEALVEALYRDEFKERYEEDVKLNEDYVGEQP